MKCVHSSTTLAIVCLLVNGACFAGDPLVAAVKEPADSTRQLLAAADEPVAASSTGPRRASPDVEPLNCVQAKLGDRRDLLGADFSSPARAR